MRTTGFLALAAALVSGVSAGNHRVAARHEELHLARDVPLAPGLNTTCGCTTIYTTYYGPATLLPPAASVEPMKNVPMAAVVPAMTDDVVPTMAVPETIDEVPTSAAVLATANVQTTAAVPATTVTVVPTAFATICPTPGVYTFPATTITVLETTTVCEATSTAIPSGTHTVGGVVTVVETATTVVCPYATTTSVNGAVTSTILTTSYVCPSAGTYTIAPLTTVVLSSTIWVYPTPAAYTPGTYSRPQNVVTVTESDFVYICPFSTPAPAPAAPTSPASAVPAVPAVPVVPAVPTTPAAPLEMAPSESAPADLAPAKPDSSPASPVPISSPNTGVLGTDSNQWAITYTPYQNDGQCKSASNVMSDIAEIAGKGFVTIRLYGTDCSGLENVGAACKAAGIKMIIGVFIDGKGIPAAQSQVDDIIAWAQFDLLQLIVVGNEAVFGGFISASGLASFVSSAKSSFTAAGYSGLVSLTEPVNIWQENADVFCGVVDVVTFNAHAFFNAETTASSAGDFIESQFEIMNALCPGKTDSYNLECGWPSAGSCNGVACPGVAQQATALASIQSMVGGKTVFLGFSNDGWKSPGEFNAEQWFGAIKCF